MRNDVMVIVRHIPRRTAVSAIYGRCADAADSSLYSSPSPCNPLHNIILTWCGIRVA